MAGRTSRSFWLLWSIVGLSVAFSWGAFAKRTGKTQTGDRFGATFTLVPEDLDGSQCALIQPFEGRGCQFQSTPEGRVSKRAAGVPAAFHAHWTTDRMLFVVEGVELEPAVINEAAHRRALPKEQRRFEAACRVEVLGWTEGGKVRWLGRTGWDPLWPMWVVKASQCRVLNAGE